MMKKILIFVVGLVVGALADEKTEFYTPSFSCENVKEGSIEYRICTDEALAELDKKLSNIYKAFPFISKEIKADQIAWMKKRNICKDKACVQESYQSRIQELTTSLANQDTFPKMYLDAMKEAQNTYEKTKNVYKPIEILRKVHIDDVVKNKPKVLSAEEYSQILQNYAKYLSHTAVDSYHGKNLHQAIKVLKRAIEVVPNEPLLYRQIGRVYLKLIKFSRSTALIPSHFIQHEYAYDESWTTLPPFMKKAYKKYVALCNEQRVSQKLTTEELNIVNRNQMFIVYDDTFKGVKSWWPRNPQPKKYKEGFETICQEYVDMLNAMPDDELFRCNRKSYVNKIFNFIGTSEEHPIFKTVHFHYINYKEQVLQDSFFGLSVKSDKNQNKHLNTCGYQYIDFNRKNQKNVGKRCSSISNYLTKYKIKREREK